MSNGQMQTRGLSAADWTRLKRLNGAKNYKNVNLDTDVDINPPTQPQLPYGRPIQVYRTVGTSKIRRPASDWIAYKASQTADYPTPSGRIIPSVDAGTVQVMTRLCSCNNYLLETKLAGCSKCQYNPIENYTPDTTPPRPVGDGLMYSSYRFQSNIGNTKPDLLDGAGAWGTGDGTVLQLPALSGLQTTDFIPYYNATGQSEYDNIAVYMVGYFRAPVTGSYVFTVESDDGFQLVMVTPGNLIINNPGRVTNGSGSSTPISLTGGEYYLMDALWSNGSGAIKLVFTDITVDGQSLPNDLDIPIKECFFIAAPS